MSRHGKRKKLDAKSIIMEELIDLKTTRQRRLMVIALQLPQTENFLEKYNKKIELALIKHKFKKWLVLFDEWQVLKKLHYEKITKIQKCIRGHLGRNRVKRIIENNHLQEKMRLFRNMTIIQCLCRTWLSRKRVQRQFLKRQKESINNSACIIQRNFRKFVANGIVTNQYRVLLVKKLRSWSLGLSSKVITAKDFQDVRSQAIILTSIQLCSIPSKPIWQIIPYKKKIHAYCIGLNLLFSYLKSKNRLLRKEFAARLEERRKMRLEDLYNCLRERVDDARFMELQLRADELIYFKQRQEREVQRKIDYIQNQKALNIGTKEEFYRLQQLEVELRKKEIELFQSEKLKEAENICITRELELMKLEDFHMKELIIQRKQLLVEEECRREEYNRVINAKKEGFLRYGPKNEKKSKITYNTHPCSFLPNEKQIIRHKRTNKSDNQEGYEDFQKPEILELLDPMRKEKEKIRVFNWEMINLVQNLPLPELNKNKLIQQINEKQNKTEKCQLDFNPFSFVEELNSITLEVNFKLSTSKEDQNPTQNSLNPEYLPCILNCSLIPAVFNTTITAQKQEKMNILSEDLGRIVKLRRFQWERRRKMREMVIANTTFGLIHGKLSIRRKELKGVKHSIRAERQKELKSASDLEVQLKPLRKTMIDAGLFLLDNIHQEIKLFLELFAVKDNPNSEKNEFDLGNSQILKNQKKKKHKRFMKKKERLKPSDPASKTNSTFPSTTEQTIKSQKTSMSSYRSDFSYSGDSDMNSYSSDNFDDTSSNGSFVSSLPSSRIMNKQISGLSTISDNSSKYRSARSHWSFISTDEDSVDEDSYGGVEGLGQLVSQFVGEIEEDAENVLEENEEEDAESDEASQFSPTPSEDQEQEDNIKEIQFPPKTTLKTRHTLSKALQSRRASKTPKLISSGRTRPSPHFQHPVHHPHHKKNMKKLFQVPTISPEEMAVRRSEDYWVAIKGLIEKIDDSIVPLGLLMALPVPPPTTRVFHDGYPRFKKPKIEETSPQQQNRKSRAKNYLRREKAPKALDKYDKRRTKMEEQMKKFEQFSNNPIEVSTSLYKPKPNQYEILGFNLFIEENLDSFDFFTWTKNMHQWVNSISCWLYDLEKKWVERFKTKAVSTLNRLNWLVQPVRDFNNLDFADEGIKLQSLETLHLEDRANELICKIQKASPIDLLELSLFSSDLSIELIQMSGNQENLTLSYDKCPLHLSAQTLEKYVARSPYTFLTWLNSIQNHTSKWIQSDSKHLLEFYQDSYIFQEFLLPENILRAACKEIFGVKYLLSELSKKEILHLSQQDSTVSLSTNWDLTKPSQFITHIKTDEKWELKFPSWMQPAQHWGQSSPVEPFWRRYLKEQQTKEIGYHTMVYEKDDKIDKVARSYFLGLRCRVKIRNWIRQCHEDRLRRNREVLCMKWEDALSETVREQAYYSLSFPIPFFKNWKNHKNRSRGSIRFFSRLNCFSRYAKVGDSSSDIGSSFNRSTFMNVFKSSRRSNFSMEGEEEEEYLGFKYLQQNPRMPTQLVKLNLEEVEEDLRFVTNDVLELFIEANFNVNTTDLITREDHTSQPASRRGSFILNFPVTFSTRHSMSSRNSSGKGKARRLSTQLTSMKGNGPFQRESTAASVNQSRIPALFRPLDLIEAIRRTRSSVTPHTHRRVKSWITGQEACLDILRGKKPTENQQYRSASVFIKDKLFDYITSTATKAQLPLSPAEKNEILRHNLQHYHDNNKSSSLIYRREPFLCKTYRSTINNYVPAMNTQDLQASIARLVRSNAHILGSRSSRDENQIKFQTSNKFKDGCVEIWIAGADNAGIVAMRVIEEPVFNQRGVLILETVEPDSSGNEVKTDIDTRDNLSEVSGEEKNVKNGTFRWFLSARNGFSSEQPLCQDRLGRLAYLYSHNERNLSARSAYALRNSEFPRAVYPALRHWQLGFIRWVFSNRYGYAEESNRNMSYAKRKRAIEVIQGFFKIMKSKKMVRKFKHKSDSDTFSSFSAFSAKNKNFVSGKRSGIRSSQSSFKNFHS